ncbi:MAG: hypothetical protein KY393_00120 [Actinobacteria bacterium]|nr:hypothetical protein [Actinomycetota bacterium]
MDLTEMMEFMDELLQKNAPEEAERPGNIVTAGIIAAEEAVKRDLVSGPFWDECGSHLLAAHYAYFKGVPLGTFTAPFIGLKFREMQKQNGETPLSPPCQL